MSMTLGELIDALKPIPGDAWIWIAKSPVLLTPSGVSSYRGYYQDLAITCATNRQAMTVKDFRATLCEALGETFTGWKGGEYQMHAKTRMWISNSGECSGARVTGVREVAGVGSCEITWEVEDE